VTQPLDHDELAARRWHAAQRGKYGGDRSVADLMTESGALLQAWRDIDVLITRLDLMQQADRLRELDLIAMRPTEVVATIPRRRVMTSEDTIAITPPTAMAASLPQDPPPVVVPPTRAEDEAWNRAVAKCQAALERALSEARAQRLDLHGIKGLVDRYVGACRRPL
jgi:hypothetical protein